MVGCLTCSSLYRCTTCKTGYYYVSTRCSLCQLGVAACCSYYVPNCVTCVSNRCNNCKVGYYVTSLATCDLCSTVISNCNSCSDQNTCTTCNDGYLL